jgi:SAM-dependent methyltransferase
MSPSINKRAVLVFTAVVGLLAAGEVVREGSATLRQLAILEQDRDMWQRPADVTAALNLRRGNSVEDLGSGAGYFALKLARIVGENGAVLAVDLRRASLAFLWIRARRLHLPAVRVVHADASVSLPRAALLDGVLIANTYHELTLPQLTLDRVWTALRPDGRLVIVDRGPALADESWKARVDDHEIPAEFVQRALRQRGFEILSADNHFIEGKSDIGSWWLIVARKPG